MGRKLRLQMAKASDYSTGLLRSEELYKFPFVLLFILTVTVGAAANPDDEKAPFPRWCLPKPGVSPENLQNIMNYVCSRIACPQSTTDPCFASSDFAVQAGIVMNLYYQRFGSTEQACFFSGNGMVVLTDPGSGSCLYPSSSSSTTTNGYFWFIISFICFGLLFRFTM